MKIKALCLTFCTVLTGTINVANAEAPLTLNADQMDRVTAAAEGLDNVTAGLIRISELQSRLASTLFASLTLPTDETVETPFGSINRKIAEIRDREINRDIGIVIR